MAAWSRAAWVAATVASAACGGSSSSVAGAPPIIDSVEAADSIKGGQALAVTVKAHDEDDTIVTVKVHLVSSSIPTQDPAPQAVPSPSKQIGIIVNIVFVAPAGTPLEYDVSLVDASGQESAAFKKNVTVL